MKGVLIVAVVFLAGGVGMIFGFCSGTTGFDFGLPLSGTSLHLDITTTGVPALAGMALTGMGAFLLIIATVIALVAVFRRDDGALMRRSEPFAE